MADADKAFSCQNPAEETGWELCRQTCNVILWSDRPLIPDTLVPDEEDGTDSDTEAGTCEPCSSDDVTESEQSDEEN